MDIKDIKILLHSFYEGETSQKDETILYNFFSGENIPEDLVTEKKIFLKLYSGQSLEIPTHLEENLNILIDNLEKKEISKKTPRISLPKISKSLSWAMSIAASVLVILSIGIFTHFERNNSHQQILADTYSNPQEAYVETQKALLLVSNKLNKGISQVEKATDHID